MTENLDDKKLTVLLHASQFAGLIIPFAGIIAPLVFWLMKKDESEMINENGKKILNFQISLIIYAIISLILMLVIIGILGLIACGIMALVFPILAMIKINNGEVYDYPLSIKFIK